MIIPIEVAALFFLLYGTLLCWLWIEHTKTIKLADQIHAEMEELKGLNFDLKTHNEILKTRNNLLSGSDSGSVFGDDTLIIDEDKTMPPFVPDNNKVTLNSLAQEVTAIKKLLDQKFSLF